MYDKKLRNRRISARVLAAILTAAMSVSAAPYTFAGTILQTGKEAASQTETEEQTEADTQDVSADKKDSEKSSYPQLETTGTQDAKVTAIDVSDVVDACMPSIVTISEKSVQEVEDYFGGKHSVEEEGAASGFIIAQTADELLIATNNHVVDNATDVTVAFSVDTDNEEDKVVAAKVKGADPSTDVAVVAVQLKDIKEDVLKQLKVAVLGNSDKLKVGQTAITIGNTLGQGLTVTSGIIAALNCKVETDEGTWTEFQTDGAANQGQSGGAVLNAKGEVIGIFNAGYLEGDNVGYAVPINTAIPVLQDLINRKTRDALDDYGYLGITVAPVTDEASQMYNIPKGAYVYSVEKGSAAEKAGLQKGDVITKFDGLSIDSRDTLLKKIQYYAPGEKVKIAYKRASGNSYEEKTAEVTLGEATDEVKAARKEQNASDSSGKKNSDGDKADGQDKNSDDNDGSSGDTDDGSQTLPPSDGSDGDGSITIPWGSFFGGQDGSGSGNEFGYPFGGGSGNGSGIPYSGQDGNSSGANGSGSAEF